MGLNLGRLDCGGLLETTDTFSERHIFGIGVVRFGRHPGVEKVAIHWAAAAPWQWPACGVFAND